MFTGRPAAEACPDTKAWTDPPLAHLNPGPSQHLNTDGTVYAALGSRTTGPSGAVRRPRIYEKAEAPLVSCGEDTVQHSSPAHTRSRLTVDFCSRQRYVRRFHVRIREVVYRQRAAAGAADGAGDDEERLRNAEERLRSAEGKLAAFSSSKGRPGPRVTCRAASNVPGRE